MTIFYKIKFTFTEKYKSCKSFSLTSVTLPTEIDNCGLMLLSKPNDEINLLKAAYLLERCFKNN